MAHDALPVAGRDVAGPRLKTLPSAAPDIMTSCRSPERIVHSRGGKNGCTEGDGDMADCDRAGYEAMLDPPRTSANPKIRGEFMSLSVIGAGFGRTGTLSLRLALERLGFGPCYHMLEVFERPEHIQVWQQAADGEPIDWDELFRGYPSAVDWPACTFYRELAARFERAKVILTVRDPERWYDSISATIFQALTRPAPEGDAVLEAHGPMAQKLILERTFGGRLDDREHVISVFERHNEAVRRAIPPERLLVFEVAEGWEPLCRFLGAPAPQEPFPRVNSKEDFRQLVAGGRVTPGGTTKRRAS